MHMKTNSVFIFCTSISFHVGHIDFGIHLGQWRFSSPVLMFVSVVFPIWKGLLLIVKYLGDHRGLLAVFETGKALSFRIPFALEEVLMLA
jgi:hypothetical protein